MILLNMIVWFNFVWSVVSQRNPPIIISEVSDKGTSNACPEDWIELQNNASWTVPLAGFKLHDDNGPDASKAYVFAAGSTLKAGEFLVLCTRADDKSPQFKIGGDDTITLRNAAGEVVSTSGQLMDAGEYDVTWVQSGT